MRKNRTKNHKMGFSNLLCFLLKYVKKLKSPLFFFQSLGELFIILCHPLKLIKFKASIKSLLVININLFRLKKKINKNDDKNKNAKFICYRIVDVPDES